MTHLLMILMNLAAFVLRLTSMIRDKASEKIKKLPRHRKRSPIQTGRASKTTISITVLVGGYEYPQVAKGAVRAGTRRNVRLLRTVRHP